MLQIVLRNGERGEIMGNENASLYNRDGAVNSVEDLAAMILDREKQARVTGLYAAKAAFREIAMNLPRRDGLTFGTIQAVLTGLLDEAEGIEESYDPVAATLKQRELYT